LHRRQQKGDEDPDDGDHDQQFDQGKPVMRTAVGPAAGRRLGGVRSRHTRKWEERPFHVEMVLALVAKAPKTAGAESAPPGIGYHDLLALHSSIAASAGLPTIMDSAAVCVLHFEFDNR
jgi:hypothetical protein